MHSRVRRIFECFAAAFVFVALTPLVAVAQTTELRLSHWVPPRSFTPVSVLEPWAKDLEKASGGSISVKIFPASQLGAAPDHYDMTVRNIADIAFVNPGYSVGRFPISSAVELPLLISESVGGSAATYQWYAKYAEREMSDVKVCLNYVHRPGTLHSKKPIRVPEDIRGLRIRTGSMVLGRFITELGGVDIEIPGPETRSGLDRGLVDAIAFPWNALATFKLEGSAYDHLDLPFYLSNAFVVIGKKTLDRLTPAQRKAVDSVCTAKLVEKYAGLWNDFDIQIYNKLRADPKHTMHTPSAEETARWRRAVAPIYEQWIKDMDGRGLNGRAILDDLRAALKARKALAEF